MRTDVDGNASLSVRLPSQPGSRYLARWFIADRAAADGFAASNAVSLTLFAPTLGRPEGIFAGRFEGPATAADRGASARGR